MNDLSSVPRVLADKSLVMPTRWVNPILFKDQRSARQSASVLPTAEGGHGEHESAGAYGNVRDVEYPAPHRADPDTDEVLDVAPMDDAIHEIPCTAREQQCKGKDCRRTPRLDEEDVCQYSKQHASDANQEKRLTPSFRQGGAQAQECAAIMNELESNGIAQIG